MIDVIKRLTELDSTNPRVVKESDVKVDECGMMGMGEMQPAMPAHPPTPASINMTAGSADELGNLLKDIVSLAGMKPADAAPMAPPQGEMPPPAEPVTGPPESPADSMRSVIDKLNPMDGEEEPEGDDKEEEPEGDDVSAAHGDVDNDGDHDMDDHDAEKKDNAEEEFDNAPSDPNKPPPFDSNKLSNQDPAGHPGVGDRMDGDRPKAFATFEDQLMYEYKKYVRG